MATAWVVEMNRDDMSLDETGWWGGETPSYCTAFYYLSHTHEQRWNWVLFLKSGFFTHLILSPTITFFSPMEPKSIGRSTRSSGRTSAARSLQSWIPLGATGRRRRRFAPSTSTGGAAGYGIAQLFDYGISTYIDIYRHISTYCSGYGTT